MKYIIKLIFLFGVIVFNSCKSTSYQNLEDGLYADIQLDRGSVLLSLNYDDTPITVANFVSLAEGSNVYVSENYKGKPYYDGLKFHRVVENYIIQGGDPLNNGTGGPGYVFEDEFPTDDEANLLLPHDKAGVLSMANSGPTTNGSQFFITHRATPNLDGKHTVFGQVVQGQNVVDSIVKDDVMNAIKIIRVGKEAKNFEAGKIFTEYFKKLEEEAKEKIEELQRIKAAFLITISENNIRAKEFSSGLKMLITEKGSGVKPKKGTQVKINYSVYFTEGSLIATSDKEKSEQYNIYNRQAESMGAYKPFSMVYSEEATLVPGFREAMLNMNYGDKAMIFVPAHLGYGAQGNQRIPPDTDLIFELEIVNQ